MGAFLRENWIWIVAPMLVVAVLLLIAFFVLGDGNVPFEYALF